MQKILILAVAFTMTTLFIGCDKDDDKAADPTVVGKWKTVKIDYYQNNVFDETEVVVEENASCPDYTEFKANGTFESIEKTATCTSTVDDSGTYTYNGTNITFVSNGATDSVKVLTLTDTDMSIEVSYAVQGAIFKTVAFLKKI